VAQTTSGCACVGGTTSAKEFCLTERLVAPAPGNGKAATKELSALGASNPGRCCICMFGANASVMCGCTAAAAGAETCLVWKQKCKNKKGQHV